jgi:hypothetical protein
LKVSIVIANVSGEQALRKCLASIEAATEGRDFEIISLRGEPSAVFRLRAKGIEQATGDRVVILGDRYEATPRWRQAILDESQPEVTTGCVAPGAALSYWGWCVYLSEYAHVAPPPTCGATTDPKLVPGGNVIYSRAVLKHFPLSPSGADLSFHSMLIDRGVDVTISPDFEVSFSSPPGLWEYIVERFQYSRLIGQQGGLKKLCIAPILPFLVLARIGRQVFGKKTYRTRFVLCVPMIALLGIVQSAGEFAGSLQRGSRAGR